MCDKIVNECEASMMLSRDADLDTKAWKSIFVKGRLFKGLFKEDFLVAIWETNGNSTEDQGKIITRIIYTLL